VEKVVDLRCDVQVKAKVLAARLRARMNMVRLPAPGLLDFDI
jgi:hypothetical protein